MEFLASRNLLTWNGFESLMADAQLQHDANPDTVVSQLSVVEEKKPDMKPEQSSEACCRCEDRFNLMLTQACRLRSRD